MRKWVSFVSFFLILALSLSLFVYAADMPENDIVGNCTISLFTWDDVIVYPNVSIPYGSFNVLYFSLNLPGYIYTSLYVDFSFTLNEYADVYLPYGFLFANDVSAVTPGLGTISCYKDGSKYDITPTTLDSVPYTGNYNQIPASFSYDETSDTYSASFGELEDFGVGSFYISFNKYTLPSGNYSFHLHPDFGSYLEAYLPIGIYIDNPSVTGGGGESESGSGSESEGETSSPASDPIIDYENGDISFSDAASQIRDQMNEVLNDEDATDYEKQIAIGVADNKLEQLQDISDEKFAIIVDEFDSKSGEIVDYLVSSGSTTVAPYIQDLNSSYADALTQATSPEQGILINTQYSVKLAQIQAIFHANVKKELDDVVSDQEMDEKESTYDRMDELLEVESEAISIFEEADYNSKLEFSNWIAQFDGDVTVYRSLFEFFFEDDKTWRIQPFLIIPFSLVLVGVLLATTTVVFRRRS